MRFIHTVHPPRPWSRDKAIHGSWLRENPNIVSHKLGLEDNSDYHAKRFNENRQKTCINWFKIIRQW